VTNNQKEKGNERASDYAQTDESGAKDSMSPEKIASHEPAAVKREILCDLDYTALLAKYSSLHQTINTLNLRFVLFYKGCL